MRAPVATYVWTLVAVAAAAGLRQLIDPWLGDHLPFVTFFVAVAVAAWLGGIGPGLLATGAGFLLALYLFIEPRYTFEARGTQQIVGLLLYVLVGLVLVGLGAAIQRSRHRAEMRREILHVTLASIGDAVITTDSDGNITFLNGVAEKLTGWSHAEAKGRPLNSVFRIINEQSREIAENPAMRVLRDGVIAGLANSTVLICKDGSEAPIDDSAAPIRDVQGEVVGCVLVFRDITIRRQLERENAARLTAARFLAAIVESSEDAIVSKSLDGIIQTWNVTAERIFGYSSQEAVGKHISLIIPEDRLDEEQEIMTSLRAGRRIEHYDTVRVRKDGRPIHISLTISPMKDDNGHIVGASKIARDITDRKWAEERTYRLMAGLKDADRRKDEFLAMLAHELRGPLAPIRNVLEVMKCAGNNGEVFLRAREMMERQLGHLVRLVDDLIDVNRITRNKIELRRERVDLASVINQAVEAFRPLCVQANHDLTVTLPAAPIYVDVDLVRLAQVFSNILSNACKYTESGGRIALTARRAGNTAVVTIQDNGMGIPPDKLDSVFDMFMQVERTLKRAQGGLGIGLTLVKRLVEMHGGTVTAFSQGAGRGSTFTVQLPIPAQQPGAIAAMHPAPPAEAPARRILVVDDNPDSATSLAMLLEMSGNETQVAHDGLAAVDAAKQFRPDVVLLDLGLPKLNGLEVCRRIRAEPWGRRMILIAMTGWGQEDDRRRSKEAGFDYHMVKPVDYTELMALLSAHATSDGRTTPEGSQILAGG